MGRKSRPVPKHLGNKLLRIREKLDMRQEDLIKKVCPWLDKAARSIISEYETGKRVPSLVELLNYSRLGGVTVDDLIDDEVEIDW